MVIVAKGCRGQLRPVGACVTPLILLLLLLCSLCVSTIFGWRSESRCVGPVRQLLGHRPELLSLQRLKQTV